MPDNDFEKQVRQKMGELRMPPSEAVWEQVDKRLQGKGKGRRRIIWFLFFITGLASGGYLLLTGERSPMLKQVPTITQNKVRPLPDVPQKENLSATSAITKNNKINLPPDSSTITGKAAVQKTRIESSTGKQNPDDHGFPKDYRKNTQVAAASGLPGTSKSFSRAIFPKELPAASERNTLPQQYEPARQIAGQQKVKEWINPPVNGIQPGIGAGVDLEPAVINGMPLLPESISTSFPVTANVPPTQLAGKLHNHNRNWQWGLTFSAGRSSVTTGTFGSLLRTNAFDNSSASYSVANPVLQGATALPRPYPTRASTGISVGTFMKKNLSEKFSISLGVNYTLFTTTNQVGKRTDSLFQQNIAGNQRSISQYYRIGNTNTYTNRYHYIEVPVMFQARLTKGRLPLYWDAGVSLSRMISSNALHYDNTARLYYINNDLLNKTQFNVITGFPVGLSARRKFKVQAGPQIQYGISQVLSSQSSAGNHFLFLGVKAGLLLDRN